MLAPALLSIALSSLAAGDYVRTFDAKSFDQPAQDAESFGDKKALTREAEGLRVTLKPGDPEAGWKTPQGLKIGGDCTIIANLVVKKLPKPAGEDGVAIGLAIASQNLDQPDATLLREVEPDGRDIYRPVDRGAGAQGPVMNRVMNRQMMIFGGMPPETKPKPVRHTFPARGATIRLEFVRKGQTVRYQVFDELAKEPREVGQFNLGPNDIAGVKLFASNRNGAEPVDVVLRDLTIHADRINGLGTAVRKIDGSIVHAEPTAIEAGALIVGGPPPAQAPASGGSPAVKPGPKPAPPTTAQPTPVAATPAAAVAVAVAAPATAPAGAVVVAQAGVQLPPGVQVTPEIAAAMSQAMARQPAGQPAQAAAPQGPKPKVRIPLDEVESIVFERASTPSGRFLGQPNVDTTGPVGTPAPDAKPAKPPTAGDDFAAPPPGTVAPVVVAKVEAKPNGIRDLHLSLAGLRDSAIKQVTVQCPTEKGQGSWRLDTSGSTDWPLTIRRAGVESWADLFLEPPAGDCNDKQFAIAIQYADNQNANIQVKATGHSDPKLAFDPAAPAPPLDARVFLAGEEQIYGKLESISEESIRLTTPWGDRVDVPTARVVGLYMGMSDHKETPESFAKRLKSRGTEDLLLARTKDGEVIPIGGVVESAKADRLTFVYGGKTRSLPLKGVEGLVFAARPGPKPPTEPRPTFSMTGGIAISGRWTSIDAATWGVETAWGQPLKLPSSDIKDVRVKGGGMTYLSDLEPSKVEETPYFGRKTPYRRDLNLEGTPLRLDGRAIEKGLAVHSRTALTYDLNRRYATFEALVGFDELGGRKGRVDCRVFADGKELYANPDLRADGPPVKLSLPVAGAEELRLVVDFGPEEDTGDRVIWAEARLFRRPSNAPARP